MLTYVGDVYIDIFRKKIQYLRNYCRHNMRETHYTERSECWFSV